MARFLPTKPHIMRNTRPLVSFTFDDVPSSAFYNGAPVLEKYGVKGTFYIAPGICGTQDEHWDVIRIEDVAELHARGHEIACHTYSHVKVQALDAQQMVDENQRCRDALERVCEGSRLDNFAYPFGVVSLPRKLQLQKEFSSCRGIYTGLNTGLVDLGLLRTVELYDRTLPRENIKRIYSEAMRENAWVIFYTHDVADPPSWIGCTPSLLEEAVAEAKAMGLACVSVEEGMAAIGA
jgi:peptidoglycan/xylan/chitin deacetylase (PgdA/CDA1 family)